MAKEYYWCDHCPTKHEQSDLTYVEYGSLNENDDIDFLTAEVCHKCYDEVLTLTTCEECGESCPIDLESMCETCIEKLEEQ